MNTEEAKGILERMMDGINPITGEVLPQEHICNNVSVIRALYVAIQAMEQNTRLCTDATEPATKRSRSGRLNNQNPWTEEEDTYLKNAYRQGISFDEMAEELLRSTRTIKFRLVYLGVADRTILGWEPAKKVEYAHQGLPWYPEEDERLTMLFIGGYPIDDIAIKLRRTFDGVASRLVKLGLIARRSDVK